MAKRLTVWVSLNGEQYPTEREALAADKAFSARKELEAILESLTSYGRVDNDDLVTMLANDKKFADAMRNYLKTV